MLKNLLIFITILSTSTIWPTRHSYDPYVAADTFRFCADVIMNEETLGLSKHLYELKDGDIIFCEQGQLCFFSQLYAHKLPARYKLISSSMDNPAPGEFGHNILSDPNLIAWFSINVTEYHPKLHPIPLGIPDHSKFPDAFCTRDQFSEKISKYKNQVKDIYVGITFSRPEENYSALKDRRNAYDYFINRAYSVHYLGPSEEYHRFLGRCKFVVSPPGWGIDCYRTWEALYLGAYPIVLSSASDPIYKALPVILVKKWEDVTEELLKQKEEEFKNYNLDKLWFGSWYNYIKCFK